MRFDHLRSNSCYVPAERKTIEAVIPGYQHSSIWELMSTLGIPADRQEVAGFLKHKGEFLDRMEVYDHALMCGQLSNTTLSTKFLETVLF